MNFKDRWTRHSVAVPKLKRTIDSWLKTPKGPKRIEREELVHINDVYRLKVKGPEGKVLWHRGAKVGVA